MKTILMVIVMFLLTSNSFSQKYDSLDMKIFQNLKNKIEKVPDSLWEEDYFNFYETKEDKVYITTYHYKEIQIRRYFSSSKNLNHYSTNYFCHYNSVEIKLPKEFDELIDPLYEKIDTYVTEKQKIKNDNKKLKEKEYTLELLGS